MTLVGELTSADGLPEDLKRRDRGWVRAAYIGAYLSAAIVAVLLAILVRIQVPGGNLFLFSIPYLLLFLVHLRVHWKVAQKPPQVPILAAGILSHVALVCAFLLQWDRDIFSHGQGGEMVLAAVIRSPYLEGPPSWWPPAWWPSFDGHEFLVPLIGSWVVLRGWRPPESGLLYLWGTAFTAAIPATVVAALTASMISGIVVGESAALRAAGGLPPGTCGKVAVPRIRSSSSLADGAFGAAPVWLDDRVEPSSVMRLEARSGDLALHGLGSLLRTHPGPFATTWFVTPGTEGPIEISLTETSSGESISIRQLNGAPGGRIDPAHPDYRQAGKTYGFVGDYDLFYRYVYANRSGCYELKASWPSGSWSIPLAIGE